MVRSSMPIQRPARSSSTVLSPSCIASAPSILTDSSRRRTKIAPGRQMISSTRPVAKAVAADGGLMTPARTPTTPIAGEPPQNAGTTAAHNNM